MSVERIGAGEELGQLGAEAGEVAIAGGDLDGDEGEGGVDQALVDEVLCRRMAPAALSDRHLLGACRQGDRLRMHQGIVEDDVGLLEQPCGAYGQQVRSTRPGADEMDFADCGHAAASEPISPGKLRRPAGGTAEAADRPQPDRFR